ncbi:MAG: hypothetical protein Hyperionvirus25_10 [Hyperionvirus sp.]|uniref:Right handed beta helix domain-containing protein n=1 Tax=Hyperionvirus sp. TaxID=2487770 RepID=A0A3G5ACU5_9VIRU|nr:MAG: hypothetical protein Hyperionvirus25_10 [Hyperionvirus sp.]
MINELDFDDPSMNKFVDETGHIISVSAEKFAKSSHDKNCRNKCSKNRSKIMITPAEVEKGYVITQSDTCYILTGDVDYQPTDSSIPAIRIAANNINLNLGAHRINGNMMGDRAIYVSSLSDAALYNVTIENGTIMNFISFGISGSVVLHVIINKVTIQDILPLEPLGATQIIAGIFIQVFGHEPGSLRVNNCKIFNVSAKGSGGISGIASFRYPIKIKNTIISNIISMGTGPTFGITYSGTNNIQTKFRIVNTIVNNITSNGNARGIDLDGANPGIYDLKITNSEISNISSTSETAIVGGIRATNIYNFKLNNNIVSNLTSGASHFTSPVGYSFISSRGVFNNCSQS